MQGLDWLILLAYLGSLTAIGFYFSRRQSSLGAFIKGEQSVGWLAVGVSLMAALNSGMDYIQTPAIVYAFGMVYVAIVFTWIPLYPWVTRVTIPFYRRLDVTSAYEYLERRFSLGVRMTASTIFVLWRLGWMGVALYVPCLAVKGTMGDDFDISGMVILFGAVVTLYTMLGGMAAIIWTDVLQFCVMFGGLFVTLAYIVTSVPGGIGQVWNAANEVGKLGFAATIHGFDSADLGGKLYLYFTTEVTFVGIVICILIGRLAAYTSDQVAVQRFQTITSFSEARKAFIVSALTDVVWMLVLGFVGLALFAFFKYQTFPPGIQNDRILPYFMAQNFPVGLTGLVIASIFAASLSSVDAALNSTTSIVTVDFYNRLWLGRRDTAAEFSVAEGRKQVAVSRMINACLGVCMTLIAANVEQMGEVYTIANKVLGAFFGILFGTFTLGMFNKRAQSGVVILAALCGLLASCFLSFFSTLTGLHATFASLLGSNFVEFCNRASWQWPPVLGVAVTLIVGYLGSRLMPARDDAQLTYWEVMRLPDPRGELAD